jgi:hypothetical protein
MGRYGWNGLKIANIYILDRITCRETFVMERLVMGGIVLGPPVIGCVVMGLFPEKSFVPGRFLIGLFSQL